MARVPPPSFTVDSRNGDSAAARETNFRKEVGHLRGEQVALGVRRI